MEKVTFEIVSSIGTISTDKRGWIKELNLVSWNGAEPKVDIRSWSPDHMEMTRGLTLTKAEADILWKRLSQYFSD